MKYRKFVLAFCVLGFAASGWAQGGHGGHSGGGHAMAGGMHSQSAAGSQHFAGGNQFRGGGQQFHGVPHYNGWHGHDHGHSHGSVGVFIGAPLWWPWYGVPYGPYGYGTPYVGVPAYEPQAPQAYISRDDPYPVWYYCDNPSGYYPYIKDCPAGWRTVAAGAPPP